MVKKSKSTRDLLHFYAKLLDSLHHQFNQAALFRIQCKQQYNIFWCHYNVEFENVLNPFNHCTLVVPYIFLSILAKKKITLCSQSSHFELLWKYALEAMLHHLCTLIQPEWLLCVICWRILNAFVLCHSSAFFLWEVRKTGLRSMLMLNFGLWFCSLSFWWISCMKSNAYALKSTGELWVSWVPIWFLKEWILSHLKMMFTLALSDFPQSHGTSQMPCEIQCNKSFPSPAHGTQRHTKESHW